MIASILEYVESHNVHVYSTAFQFFMIASSRASSWRRGGTGSLSILYDCFKFTYVYDMNKKLLLSILYDCF